MSGSEMTRRVALVTGASRGIGRAIAVRLARDGADVACVYLREAAQAQEVRQEIEGLGRQALLIQADLADLGAGKAVVDQVVAAWGRLDILVNNAAVFSRSKVADTPDEEFLSTFAVNVGGVFSFMRAALPVMYAQRSGRIINLSSHNAKRGTGGSSKATYAATKSAVDSYTKGTAVEAAPYNVTVNSIAPGWIEKGEPPAERNEFQKGLLAGIPLGRPGRPEEVAAAVAFLASEEAGYVTGEIFDINGGSWMD